MENPNRRKNYWIKKTFQASFAFRFSLLVGCAAVLVAGIFLYVSEGTLTTGYYQGELTVAKTSDFFLLSLILIGLLVSIAVGAAGIIVFVVLSHRLAGPLYRVERGLEELANGNLAHRIQLRKQDQLQELANALNHTAVKMDEKVGSLRRQVEETIQRLSTQETQPDMSRFKQTLTNLKEFMNHFRTSS